MSLYSDRARCMYSFFTSQTMNLTFFVLGGIKNVVLGTKGQRGFSERRKQPVNSGDAIPFLKLSAAEKFMKYFKIPQCCH